MDTLMGSYESAMWKWTVKKNVKGFSLIEVMIVILLLGILAAYVVPNFGYRTLRSQMAAGVSELQSSLAMARSTAITNGHKAIVKEENDNDDFLGKTWQVISVDNNGQQNIVGVFKSPKGLDSFKMVNHSGNKQITFLGDGRRDPATPAEFCLEGEREGNKIVRKVVISGAGQVIVSAPAACP